MVDPAPPISAPAGHTPADAEQTPYAMRTNANSCQPQSRNIFPALSNAQVIPSRWITSSNPDKANFSRAWIRSHFSELGNCFPFKDNGGRHHTKNPMARFLRACAHAHGETFPPHDRPSWGTIVAPARPQTPGTPRNRGAPRLRRSEQRGATKTGLKRRPGLLTPGRPRRRPGGDRRFARRGVGRARRPLFSRDPLSRALVRPPRAAALARRRVAPHSQQPPPVIRRLSRDPPSGDTVLRQRSFAPRIPQPPTRHPRAEAAARPSQDGRRRPTPRSAAMEVGCAPCRFSTCRRA